MGFKPYPKSMSVGEYRKLASISTKKNKKKTRHDWFYNSSAWKWFRTWAMTVYIDPRTMTVPDFTRNRQPIPVPSKDTHLGHFVKVFEGNSQRMIIAFDIRNVLPQNSQDNRYSGGKQDVMAIEIDKIHGPGTSQELVRLGKNWIKLTDYDLDKIAKKYHRLAIELAEKKGIPYWWT